MVVYSLYGVIALLALAPIAILLSASERATGVIYGMSFIVTLVLCAIALRGLFGYVPNPSSVTLPLGLPWLGAHFRIDAVASILPRRDQSRRCGNESVRARLWPP